jgi:hypothetical protein
VSSIRDRYAALPRAVRWLLLAAAFCAIYFAAVEPALDRTSRLGVAADALAASLARERQLAAAWSDSNTPAAAAKAAFGSPALPGPSEPRSRALYTRINKIFEAHGIVPDINERRAPLRADQAAAIAGPGYRIDRFILDLTFESSPEVAAAVLAELEQSAEVAAVGRVQIRRVEGPRAGGASSSREAPRRVRAVLSPEAWVLVPGATS